MAGFRIVISNPGPQFKAKMAEYTARLNRTIDATMRMIQSMLSDAAKADIAGAGNFGSRWTDGLHVNLEGAAPNMRLSMTHDVSYAKIFETGGTIEGHPLLWLPLSNSDAVMVERASVFPGGVRGGRGTRTGTPLLFSVADGKPKYVGVPSVTIPRKFHLAEDVNNAVANFRQVFSDQWNASK
jgi:hypothetical protein